MKTLKPLISTLFAGTLLSLVATAEPLAVGATVSAVTVTVDTGDSIDLATVYAAGPVLVYFYPKSFTGGCTKQACNIRDNFPDITDTGITVIGVSADDVETQARFREEYELPFHLVADTKGALAASFGVPVSGDYRPSRQSFLVVDGKVAWRDLKANPVTQAQDALDAYAGLKE